MKIDNTRVRSFRVGPIVTCILFAGCIFAAASSSASLVTATAEGTFGDGATWTAVATWDTSAMADSDVTVSEMDSFDIITTGGVIPGESYDLDSSVTSHLYGFDFNGTTPNSTLLGTYGGVAGYYYFGSKYPSQIELGQESGMHEIDYTLIDRYGTTRPVWSISVVPEPSTFMLFALGAIGLLGSGGRRRRRHARS